MGILQHVTRGPNRGYGRPLIAVLDAEQGQRSLWLLGEVLLNQLRDAAPQRGEPVLVRYLGKKTSEAGRGYKAWRVVTDRADDGMIDWASVEDEPVTDPDDAQSFFRGRSPRRRPPPWGEGVRGSRAAVLAVLRNEPPLLVLLNVPQETSGSAASPPRPARRRGATPRAMELAGLGGQQLRGVAVGARGRG